MRQIGLIGIGLLGSAIARRFADNGLEVLGFDPDKTKLENVQRPMDSPQAVFDQCDTVLLSLPTSDVSRTVIASNRTRAGQVIVDTTTGEPAQMQQVEQIVVEQGARYAEATVAGSSQQMERGEAVLFVGCDPDLYEELSSVLTLLSTKAFHLGQVGAASRFKLVHNLVLGLNRAVLAEGLIFSEAMGFELSETLEILRQTPAASGVMSTKGPKMVAADFTTQARLSQHLKDVRLILSESKDSNAKTPLSELHRELLEQAESLGFGDVDNSAIIEAFRRG